VNTIFPLDLPAATAFYLVIYLATLVLHMVFMHYVLAGSTYLVFGRLMGRIRCAACGWQAILADWLPFATGLAITAGVAPLLFVQILYGREFATANLLLSHRWMAILPVLIACFYLLYLQKSSWIGRRSWIWRPAVAAVIWAGFVFIAWSWTENHLLMLDRPAWPGLYENGVYRYESPGIMPRLAIWFFLAFPSLAIELAWQGRLLGVPLDASPAPDAIVAGLSPVRRLALMACAGLVGTALAACGYWPTLSDAARNALTGPLAGPWLRILAGAFAVQVVAWTWAASRDRLAQPLLLVATCGWLVGLACVVVVREAVRLTAVDLAAAEGAHATALRIGGLAVFLAFGILNAAAIVWCIRTVRAAVRDHGAEKR
jgi:hypothetical protein